MCRLALTPLASYGSGLLPQGLLPSVYAAPNAGQNNAPLGAWEGSQRLRRMGELTCGVDRMLTSDNEIGVRQRG